MRPQKPMFKLERHEAPRTHQVLVETQEWRASKLSRSSSPCSRRRPSSRSDGRRKLALRRRARASRYLEQSMSSAPQRSRCRATTSRACARPRPRSSPRRRCRVTTSRRCTRRSRSRRRPRRRRAPGGRRARRDPLAQLGRPAVRPAKTPWRADYLSAVGSAARDQDDACGVRRHDLRRLPVGGGLRGPDQDAAGGAPAPAAVKNSGDYLSAMVSAAPAVRARRCRATTSRRWPRRPRSRRRPRRARPLGGHGQALRRLPLGDGHGGPDQDDARGGGAGGGQALRRLPLGDGHGGPDQDDARGARAAAVKPSARLPLGDGHGGPIKTTPAAAGVLSATSRRATPVSMLGDYLSAMVSEMAGPVVSAPAADRRRQRLLRPRPQRRRNDLYLSSVVARSYAKPNTAPAVKPAKPMPGDYLSAMGSATPIKRTAAPAAPAAAAPGGGRAGGGRQGGGRAGGGALQWRPRRRRRRRRRPRRRRPRRRVTISRRSAQARRENLRRRRRSGGSMCAGGPCRRAGAAAVAAAAPASEAHASSAKVDERVARRHRRADGRGRGGRRRASVLASIAELGAKDPKLARIGWQRDTPQADADSEAEEPALTAEDVFARLQKMGLRQPAPATEPAQKVEATTRAANSGAGGARQSVSPAVRWCQYHIAGSRQQGFSVNQITAGAAAAFRVAFPWAGSEALVEMGEEQEAQQREGS